MTETAPARLRLAVELDGHGVHPAAAGPPPADAALLRRRVAAAEQAGFDLITLDDSPLPPPADPEGRPVHRIEAGVRAAHVATRTDRTGLAPTLHPASLREVVDQLVPELQERGVYRTAYQGTTLREHLALPSLG